MPLICHACKPYDLRDLTQHTNSFSTQLVASKTGSIKYHAVSSSDIVYFHHYDKYTYANGWSYSFCCAVQQDALAPQGAYEVESLCHSYRVAILSLHNRQQGNIGCSYVCCVSWNGCSYAVNLPTFDLPCWLMHLEPGSSQLLSYYHCCSGVQRWLCAKQFRLSLTQCHENNKLVLQPANPQTIAPLPKLHNQHQYKRRNCTA